MEGRSTAAVDIRADYVAKNGAPSATAPKIFFRYYLVDSSPGAFPPGTSPESFYRRPQSQPINKLISEVFFKSGLMEAWGRGIPDIFDLCRESGLPKPEFELANGYVYLTIRFKHSLTPYLSGGVNGGVNDGVNSEADIAGKAFRTSSLENVYRPLGSHPMFAAVSNSSLYTVLALSPGFIARISHLVSIFCR